MDPATLESLIVKEIRKANSISRRDLADQLDVARSTAGRRVDSLIERGLVKEDGLEERFEAGRPKRFLALCGEFGHFIGFDFDARHIFAVLTDFAQNVLAEEQIRLSTPASRDEVMTQIKQTMTKFESLGSTSPILGYGFGVPGRVRQEDRVGVSYPYIEGWSDVDFAESLELDPADFYLENNTKTIALGEYWLGHGTPPEHLVCVNIRTGISAAVISNGHMLRGIHEMAGEIRGWKITGKPDPEWLEDGATVRSILNNTTLTGWQKYVDACLSGEKDAIAKLEAIVPYHADAISRLVQLADPELVVLSGAFNELGSLYLDRIRKATAEALAHHYFDPPPIQFAAKGAFTGALGAAALAAKHFKPDSSSITPSPKPSRRRRGSRRRRQAAT
ncbi:MAG: ROK family transcriptional regulator [Verrucomicrobiota bacterium]